MQFQQWNRNPKKVHAALEKTDDGAVIAKKACAIYLPRKWRDKDLVHIANEIYITAIYALVVEDQDYAISVVNTMIRVNPNTINEVVIDDTDYLEMVFDPGDQVFANTDVVVNKKLLYSIFDEIVTHGNVPAFMNYLDLGRLFETAESFGDTRLASSPTILQMLLSMIARDPNDKMRYFRQVSTGDDLEQVAYVSLQSSIYGPTNTTARMIGANFSDNLNAAMIHPSEQEEDIEHILRR